MTVETSLQQSDFSFLNLARHYYRYSTDAPIRFGEITAIMALGHALGHDMVNLIQPKAVHHNMYVLCVGESTLSRKTTVQDLGKDIYPIERCIANETTPERLIEALSEQNEAVQWLGEFSGILKGIKYHTYMTKIAEYYNDLFSCRRFVRETKARKDKKTFFVVARPYLSLHSTITPTVLKEYMSQEMFEGGLMARFWIEYGEPNPKPRGLLEPDIFRFQDFLKHDLIDLIKMDKSNVAFEFSPEALEYYNKVVEPEAYSFRKVTAFAGRYLNYAVSIADIMLVSDAIGVAWDRDSTISKIGRFVELVTLLQNVTTENATNYTNTTNHTNSTKFTKIIVPREYIVRSWQFVKPSLTYINELSNYVEMKKHIARVREYMLKHKDQERIYHSDVLRNANVNATEMEEATRTLIQREEITHGYQEVTANNRRYVREYYRWIKKESDSQKEGLT